MPTDRVVQETVARCVSCMVFYAAGGKSGPHKNVMAAEVGTIARMVAGWGLDGEVGDAVLGPVGDELIARFGLAEGGNVFLEFAEAFQAANREGPRHSQAPG